jgi:hypothetical protein
MKDEVLLDTYLNGTLNLICMTRVKFSKSYKVLYTLQQLTMPFWSSEILFQPMSNNGGSSRCKVFVVDFPSSQHKVPQLSLNCTSPLLPIACRIFQTSHHLVATNLKSQQL